MTLPQAAAAVAATAATQQDGVQKRRTSTSARTAGKVARSGLSYRIAGPAKHNYMYRGGRSTYTRLWRPTCAEAWTGARGPREGQREGLERWRARASEPVEASEFEGEVISGGTTNGELEKWGSCIDCYYDRDIGLRDFANVALRQVMPVKMESVRVYTCTLIPCSERRDKLI
eukprot:1157278-Pelagomonas_calceolata.AAC.2